MTVGSEFWGIVVAVSAATCAERSLLALRTRHMEDIAIAAPAIIGLSSHPVKGYSTPAAKGMPMML